MELVSPHHAARELVNTLKQGQITSLFQKSVKRVRKCIVFIKSKYLLLFPCCVHGSIVSEGTRTKEAKKEQGTIFRNDPRN